MALTKTELLALEKKAHELRKLCLDTTYWAGSAHIGGGMSVMDIMTVLYHKYMHLDKDNPNWEDRDRFILSKGHAGVAYAAVLCDYGYNDPEQLKTFNYAIQQIVAGGIARSGSSMAVTCILMIPPIVVYMISQSNVMESMSSAGIKE